MPGASRLLRSAIDRSRPRRDAMVAWLDAVAEFWLGYAIPPAARAVAESGWEPDARGSYCGRCGASVGPGEGGPAGCAICRDRSPIADDLVRLGSYAGPLREWILDIKYRHRWEEMAEILGARLGAQVAASGVVDAGRSIVVPVPMPWPRRLSRGIDHARAVGRGVASSLGAPLVVPLSRRAVEPPQVNVTRSQRLRRGGRGIRVRRGFAARAREGLPLAATQVVLVDDVVTTGSTVRAAVRWLRRLGAERVIAAVLAVADDGRRTVRGQGGGGGPSEARRWEGRRG